MAFANSSLTLTRNLRVPFDGVADLVFNRNFIQVLTMPTPLEISVFLFPMEEIPAQSADQASAISNAVCNFVICHSRIFSKFPMPIRLLNFF